MTVHYNKEELDELEVEEVRDVKRGMRGGRCDIIQT